jgi:hypothetical protein
VLLPPYNLLGMDTRLLGCAAFHVLVCVHACVCAVSWCTKAIEESSSSMPIECVLGGGHFSPVTFDRQQVSVIEPRNPIVHRKPAIQVTHNGVGAT